MSTKLSLVDRDYENALAKDLWFLLDIWRKEQALSYIQVIGVLDYIKFQLMLELDIAGDEPEEFELTSSVYDPRKKY